MMTNETGPIYCIPLIERMPLGDSGMTQAMPSRADLRMCRGRNERVAAGYEVLLAHYHRVCEERDKWKAAHELLTKSVAMFCADSRQIITRSNGL